ncbi:hypothetical protein ACNKCE_000176 [Cronobacter turicensis]
MKERPIILNAEMVRAVLNGSKTQTRRIVSWRGLSEGLNMNFSGLKVCGYPKGWVIESDTRSSSEWRCHPTPCPFGAVGDRLWVRETFQGPLIPENELSEFLGANPDRFQSPAYCEYAADGGPRPEYVDAEDNTRHGWRPAIHMPRWASRITLEITGVRVERLNDINEQDARAEGVGRLRGGFWRHYQPGWTQHQLSARGSFVTLWKSIYGDESWQANPWVWVIDFKRVEGGAA